MLTFKFKDLKEALEECGERFKGNIAITSSLLAVRELFTTGSDEYVKIKCCKMSIHNALGFRILAANIMAVMCEVAYREKFGKDVLGRIDYRLSEKDKKYYCNSDNMKREVLASGEWKEPAMEKWCKVFNIPFSRDVNLGKLYYSNIDFQ